VFQGVLGNWRESLLTTPPAGQSDSFNYDVVAFVSAAGSCHIGRQDADDDRAISAD